MSTLIKRRNFPDRIILKLRSRWRATGRDEPRPYNLIRS